MLPNGAPPHCVSSDVAEKGMNGTETISSVTNPIMDVPVESLDLRYERLRLVRPREYGLIRDSIRRYGQLHPASGGAVPEGRGRYALIDGFKRYRACIDLAVPTMSVRIIEGGVHAHKAAIIIFNRDRGPVHAFEEALVVRSLYHDDKLNQEQIATLFCRHKSWACRRIALSERLCDEAIEELRLGLLGFASAREIGRLPRGNQPQALSCMHAHRLSSRETGRLVRHLMQSPRWEHEAYLRLPLDILDDRRESHRRLPYPDAGRLYRRLIDALQRSTIAIETVQRCGVMFDATQRNAVLTTIETNAASLSGLQRALKDASDGC